MALGSTMTEMNEVNTGEIPGRKDDLPCKTDKLTAICEPIV
jgi:hypothetical protein